MNIKEKMQLLGIQEVTTKRQKNNGTREFKLPINDPYGDAIHVASFASGYVRRTKTGGYSSDWQLNKTKKKKRYVEMNDYDTGRPIIRTFHDTVRVLIENEQERLDYLISYCLKNYYINQANKLSNGEYIPKWKHEADLSEQFAKGFGHANEVQEVKVIVNGHRYNVI
tara:strand:- start:68 stop:571 length:504 start_codon:yes stop_codon:yes gene_type:complete